MLVRLTILLLVALFAASAASPLPELQTQARDGGSTFIVKNTASQPLTAYLIELVNYPGSAYSLWQDELLANTSVASQSTRTIPVVNMTVGAAPEYVKLTAALYADGSTAGDPAKVAQFIARRRFLQQTAHDLAGRLAQAESAATPKPALLSSLTQWAESFPPPTRTNRYTQEGINNAAARQWLHEQFTALNSQSVGAVLTQVRLTEAALSAASK